MATIRASAAAVGAVLLICIFHQIGVTSASGASFGYGRTGVPRKLLAESPDGPNPNPDVVSYWDDKVGKAGLPAEWLLKLSHLSRAQVAQFHKAIASRDLLSSSHDSEAAAFCSDAGLICQPNNQPTSSVQPQGVDVWFNAGWEESTSLAAAPKESSNLKPDGVDVWFNAGWEEAEPDSASLAAAPRESFTLKPDGVDVWFNAGWEEAEPDSASLAAAPKESSSSLHPDGVDVWFNAGWEEALPDSASLAAAAPRGRETFSESQLEGARKFYFVKEDMPAPGSQVPAELFSAVELPQSGAFLPRLLASDLGKLEWGDVLQALRVPRGSTWASILNATHDRCANYHGVVHSEVRTCTHSLEDVADFVAAQLPAGNVRGEVSGAVDLQGGSANVSFVVTKVDLIGEASRPNVLCHPHYFPYTVLACHSIQETEIYSVTLVPWSSVNSSAPQVSVSNLVACHTNTTHFRPDHIAFQALRIEAGQEGGVCHWTKPASAAFYTASRS